MLLDASISMFRRHVRYFRLRTTSMEVSIEIHRNSIKFSISRFKISQSPHFLFFLVLQLRLRRLRMRTKFLTVEIFCGSCNDIDDVLDGVDACYQFVSSCQHFSGSTCQRLSFARPHDLVAQLGSSKRSS